MPIPPIPTLPARARRSLLLAIVVLLTLVACDPVPPPPAAPPSTTVPAPVGAALTVGSPAIRRGESVVVNASGCTGDLHYVEARLVVGAGSQRRGIALTSATTGDAAHLVVPRWAPDGSAVIEGSCLEPDLSRASDGADVVAFDFVPVAVSISGSAEPTSPPTLSVPAVVDDGTVRVSGTGCGGPVLVSVAAGTVPSASRFHHGRTLVSSAPDGSWSATLALTYHTGELTDPVAPGPLGVFAVCEGWWYAPASVEVAAASPTPAIHQIGPGPALVALTQCPSYNTVSVIGLVRSADGATTVVRRQEPGRGYGEHLYPFTLPAGAVEVGWFASCTGAQPSFSYQPLTWSGR